MSSLIAVEIEDNLFSIKVDNREYKLSMKLNNNSIQFKINNCLLPINFESTFTLDELTKISIVFHIFEPIENVFSILKKKIVEAEYLLHEKEERIIL
jgi:hypothetical protein